VTLLNRELVGRLKLCQVSVLPVIVKDCCKIRNVGRCRGCSIQWRVLLSTSLSVVCQQLLTRPMRRTVTVMALLMWPSNGVSTLHCSKNRPSTSLQSW